MSIRSEEIVAFTQQFANLVGAGITLTNSLSALEKQEENKELRKVIGEVRVAVEGGTLLSEALAKHPSVFSRFFVSMVYAGEQGAGLPKVLKRIASHIEKEHSLKQTIKGVFAYPAVTGALVLIIVVFLLVAVAPVFADVYHKLGVSLPLPTRLLLAISYFMRKFWWVMAAVVGLLYYYYRRYPALSAKLMESAVASIPLLGKLLRKVAVAGFIRTFGDMLSCAVPIIDSLDIADKVVGNSEISAAVHEMKSSIESGGTLTSVLSRNEVFPPAVVQMAYAGEQSGALGEMFEKCAEALEQDVEFSAKRLLVILEPALTLILAGVVGFIAMAIYLPMFDLVRLVSQ